jgi:PAS domain S-box-containing protein
VANRAGVVDFLAMGKGPNPHRTFMMSAGFAQKDSGNPALRLSSYQGIAHVRHGAVSEKKQSLDKLHQGEETSAGWGRLFRSWFDDNPLPMMAFDRENLAILAVNESAIRHYGYSREEFLGMTIKDIRPPEDIPHLLDALRAGDRGISGPFMGRHRKKEGTLLEVEVYSQSAAAGSRTIVLAQIHDITERKRTEEALRRSEQQLRSLFEFSPDAVLVTNQEGRITEANAQVERLFGYSRRELLGQPVEVLIPERFRDAHPAHRRDFHAEPRLRPMGAGLELYGRRKDGSEFHVDIMLSPIETAEGRAVLTVIRDICEEKRADEALLLELSGVLLANLEVDKLLSAFSAGIQQLVPHDWAALAFHEPEADQLRLQLLDLAYEKGMPSKEITVPVEGSAQGWVFRKRTPLILNLLDKHRFKSEPLQHLIAAGLKSACWLPLISRDRTLGILAVASRRESAFTEKDVAVLGQVAKQVAVALDNALAFRRLADVRDKLNLERRYLEQELRTEYNFEDIVGASASLKRVLKQVETVAPTNSTVLILGETGAGKELIARAIHQLSPRCERAFVKLNCAAIPSGLLESELFGHERGAFTGAIAQKIGLMELAHQGTLFLDEVGDLPLELQPKLLRALQEREFQRLGGTRTLPIDVRLVAATNHDLAKMVNDLQFRIELYYRLKVFPITVPPLRERPEEIPILVYHFALKHSRRIGKRIETIPPEVMQALTRWRWPGNVRELENFIERAVILSQGPVLRAPLSELELPEETPAAPLDTTLEAAEREQIIRVLRETRGVIGGPRGAAVRLGLKRTTLNAKIRKLGIDRRDYI